MDDNNLDYDNKVYTPPEFAPKPPHSKKPLLFILILIILLAAGFGGYKLFAKKPAKPIAQVNSTQNQQPAKDVPDSTASATYNNTTLGLTLTYPNNWTFTEAADKTGVRFESPDFSYTTMAGSNVTGDFRLYIRQGARPADSKYIGRAVAIEPSTKLTYTKPLSTQRKDTYLSLFGLDTPDNFALLMIAGNFNLNKGDTLGPNYGKESETFIIAGGFSSKDLKDDLQTNTVPISAVQTSNAYKQTIEMLKSLQLQ